MLQSLAMSATSDAPAAKDRIWKRPLSWEPEVLPSPSEAFGLVPVIVSNVKRPD